MPDKKTLHIDIVIDGGDYFTLTGEYSDTPNLTAIGDSAFSIGEGPTNAGIVRQHQRQIARGPRAVEQREMILKQWNKLSSAGIPERERAKKIADLLGEPRRSIDYHIRSLDLRPQKRKNTISK